MLEKGKFVVLGFLCCLVLYNRGCKAANRQSHVGSGHIMSDLLSRGSLTQRRSKARYETAVGNDHQSFHSRTLHKKTVSEDCLTPHEMEGQLRLAAGMSEYHGRVEIYHNGEWGSVCDDNFDDRDARVVCRQLGYGFITTRVDTSVPASTNLKTWMDEVACIGDEERLADCSFSGWNNEDCSKSEDVGVYCDVPGATVPPLYDGKIRLVAGGTEYIGRVEIYHSGEWGTVCDDSFGVNDAKVVCRQLGYSGGKVSTSVPSGSGITWMDEVACNGNEEYLKDCSFNGWGREDCSHSEDVGVICNDPNAPPPPQSGDIRLVGGSTQYEGRVEIYHQEQWGTVCDDAWTTSDAVVVCRQLQFGGGIAKTEAFYGEGEGPTWMDEVQCTGREARLSDCSFRGWGYEDCGHTEDAGVQCSPPVMTTTPQMETTTEMIGCFNESQFECFTSKICIDVDEMCNGEQNCADASDERVCNNTYHIIAQLGDEVSFVCAAPYSTVGKVVSWFHKNATTKEAELISMDDFIFASNGNFSAERLNQRVNMLILHGVAERNVGIYECHVDNFDQIAKHELSLQQDPEPVPVPEGGDPEPEGGDPEPEGGDNVDCLTESTNCFSVLGSLDPNGGVVAMCSTSRRFLACVDNLPQRCLEGQEALLQNLEQQRNTMEALCNNIGGGGDVTSPPVGGDGSSECASNVTTCTSIMSDIGVGGDIATICSAIPRLLTCFENIPQHCLAGRDDLLRSLQEQRNILNNVCGVNVESGGDVVYVNSTLEMEMGQEDNCMIRAQTCMSNKFMNMTDLIGPSSDPAVRSRLCGVISTCLENSECQPQDLSRIPGSRLLMEYCSENVTRDGCPASTILDCYLPFLFADNKQEVTKNETIICSLFQKFEGCISHLPENCQVNEDVNNTIVVGQHYCERLTAETNTPDPSMCRFREYPGYNILMYPRFPVAGSSVYNVEECKRECDDRCHGFIFSPFSSGDGGSCSLYDVGSVAAIYQNSERQIYYEKDCFEAEHGPCDRLQNSRCQTGECIPNSVICDGNNDCSDGSDEQDCDTESVMLQHGMDGIVMLKMRGKTAFICDEVGSFSDSGANVLCKSLGYRYGNKYTSMHNMVYPQSWVSNVACQDNEKDIFDCSYENVRSCSVQKAVAVSCNY